MKDIYIEVVYYALNLSLCILCHKFLAIVQFCVDVDNDKNVINNKKKNI